MKKLTLLLLALIIMSCSKDSTDDLPPPQNDYWTFYFKDDCSQTQPTGNFCVEQSEYDLAMQNKVYIDNICFKIRIKDLQGNLEWYIWSGAINQCQ